MQKNKIKTCFWVNDDLDNVVAYYQNIFGANCEKISQNPMVAMLRIFDAEVVFINGGPIFKANPSISLFVNFDPSTNPAAAQDIDHLWARFEDKKVLMDLAEYPFSKRYGWLEDKYGVNWQLILTNLEGEPRPNIVPSLMFVGQVCGRAEEATDFYMKIFKNSKRGTMAKYPAGSETDKQGTVMFTDCCLDGTWIAAMDSGFPHDFTFDEGVSLMVDCQGQEEVDYFWNSFVQDGGVESQCGWCKDKFGVSWQIVPVELQQAMSNPNREEAQYAQEQMLKMKKIIIKDLYK